ncbi:hypothetical protein D9M68_940310 [compost metagenome]
MAALNGKIIDLVAYQAESSSGTWQKPDLVRCENRHIGKLVTIFYYGIRELHFYSSAYLGEFRLWLTIRPPG